MKTALRKILGPRWSSRRWGWPRRPHRRCEGEDRGQVRHRERVKLALPHGRRGEPVLLLHGFAQNSRMWRPLMAELGKTRRVIAPNLRGFGDSAKPACCYDKKSMAQDIHALARSLGIRKARVAEHDIGLMVAYAYAAQYPARSSHRVVRRLHSGCGGYDEPLPAEGPGTSTSTGKTRWPSSTAAARLLGTSGTTSPPTARNSFRADGSFTRRSTSSPARSRRAWRCSATRPGRQGQRRLPERRRSNADDRLGRREIRQGLPDHAGQDARPTSRA